MRIGTWVAVWAVLFAAIRWSIVLAGASLSSLTGCYRWVAVGDSILYGQESALEDSIDGDGVLDAVIARSSSGTLAAADRLVGDVVADGWLVVQEDGGGDTVESYRALVDAVVELTPDDRCIAWVLPFNEYTADRDALIADEIRAGLGIQPCHATIDWPAVASVDGGGMLHDGLHPTAAGHAWLVDAIANIVN